MKEIEVSSAQTDYSVVVGADLLRRLPELAAERGINAAAAVVSNSTVGPLYGRSLAERLALAPPLELPDGERFKQWNQVERVCSWLLDHGVHRGATVVGVGGGVLTDMVGFAAAVYLRGISWIALPTTLLAMVDASVGGKTGVNLPQGKNLLGCFWPPLLVVADVATLVTLPPRELRAGMAEVVKSAWIGDRGMLALLDRELTDYQCLPIERWQELVVGCVKVKAEVVSEDEREAGRRQALNLGHTLGHAFEAATEYQRLLHGEAVSWGLLGEAVIATSRGLLSGDNLHRLRTAIEYLRPLPRVDDITADVVLEHIAHDKKRDDLGIAWALPSDDGVALGSRVSADEVREALAEIAKLGPAMAERPAMR